MGSGHSHEDESKRYRAKVLAVGALSPKPKPQNGDVRDFIEQQKKNKEQLWQEIQAQYDNKTSPQDNISSIQDSLDEEVESDMVCPLCSKDALFQSFCCRVCGVCHHKRCLITAQVATKEQDNVYKLLTREELTEIRVQFEAVDHNHDRRVSLDEYMDYQRTQFEALEGRPMTSFEESFERLHFRRLDADGSGFVDFPEFLKFNAGKYLSRRGKDDLVELLTKREIQSARKMFNNLDQDKSGSLTSSELHVAYHGWYRTMQNAGLEMSTSELVDRRVEMLMEGDADNDRLVTWEEYLRNQALYILASRPNGANYMGPYVNT